MPYQQRLPLTRFLVRGAVTLARRYVIEIRGLERLKLTNNWVFRYITASPASSPTSAAGINRRALR